MAYGTFKSVEEVATKFDIEVADTTASVGWVGTKWKPTLHHCTLLRVP